MQYQKVTVRKDEKTASKQQKNYIVSLLDKDYIYRKVIVRIIDLCSSFDRYHGLKNNIKYIHVFQFGYKILHKSGQHADQIIVRILLHA